MSAQVQQVKSGSFWREMRDGDHVCQVYEGDAGFLDSLTGFVGHGLWTGEAAVVIATEPHLVGLEQRLRQSGLDLGHLRAHDCYITLSPAMTLAQFMENDWPSAARFDAVISNVVARARGKGRAVRAFGEMVALLWEREQYAATVRLERLWQDIAAREGLQVLCSYPRRSFSSGPANARSQVAGNHTRGVAS